ncbi:sulfatase-like hydrolase/transferase [Leisingera sp. ANG59]|uniref:sulfatase-like hydrolase/transferase n=1 Tax=Leisingera sp. ANG59 TaxID=2675221 RepID=UPI0020C70B34|nr:sulfatase-like hydrolase/transferase [Leisingera sp. ANG59]
MALPVGYGEGLPDHEELRNIAGFFNCDAYFDEQKMRAAKAPYYGLTSFMDHCAGRVIRALEASGQLENTVVLYVSDHGDVMGDQGFWTKQVMYEQSAGVPMIAAGPGIPAAQKVATCTSQTDIAATTREVCGVAEDAGLPGVSLRAIANAPSDESRTGFSEYHDGGSRTGAFMVRWGRWKYVHFAGMPPQLFDLEGDPHEQADRAMDGGKDSQIKAALAEGERRRRAICDPEKVNARAFADQRRRIAELGGEEACRTAYVFNHTPTPDEQDKMREGSPL